MKEPGSNVRAKTVVRHLVPAVFVAGLAAASVSAASIQAVGSSAPAHATVAFGSSPEAGELFAVATTQGGDAWAVGYSGTDTDSKALTLFWNGSHWKPAPSPSPADSQLRGVAATSPTNVWAVGSSGVQPQSNTLILHRKGNVWQRLDEPGGHSLLRGGNFTHQRVGGRFEQQRRQLDLALEREVVAAGAEPGRFPLIGGRHFTHECLGGWIDQ